MGLLREGVYGWINVEDCDYRPRAFLIELHNMMDLESYIKTLLHELQHMHQHIRGDLRDKGAKRLWRGLDCTNMDYENLPWEIEASIMESELYSMYLTVINNQEVESIENRLLLFDPYSSSSQYYLH
jgi:hypothetical protein